MTNTDPPRDDNESKRKQAISDAGSRVKDAGNAISRIPGVIMVMVAYGLIWIIPAKLTKMIPKKHKFWSGLAKIALKNVKKSTGADIIGMLPESGSQLTPAPMKVKKREEDGSQYWATIENDVEYDLGPQGLSRMFIGNVPVGFFVEDPPREVSLLEGRIRDAVDMDQFDGVYTDPNVTLHEYIYREGPGGNGDGQVDAIADGGQTANIEQVLDREIEVEASDLPDDYMVDLSTDSGNGARVSWARANDILHEKTTTDEMNRQEQRGELAGAAGNDNNMKIYIYAMAAVVAVVFAFLFGPSIIQGIFGNWSGAASLPTLGG